MFLNPFTELFLWAILANKPNCAKSFWKQGNESLIKALVGRILLRKLLKYEIDSEEIKGLMVSEAQ